MRFAGRLWVDSHSLSSAFPRSLTCSRELLQLLIADHIQSFLVGCVQMYLRYSFLLELSVLESLVCFLPSRCAQAPFHPRLHTSFFEVVASTIREFEEGFGDGGTNRVVAFVVFCDAAVAISIEARAVVFDELGESASSN